MTVSQYRKARKWALYHARMSRRLAVGVNAETGRSGARAMQQEMRRIRARFYH